jgi:hypothetical protein
MTDSGLSTSINDQVKELKKWVSSAAAKWGNQIYVRGNIQNAR